ncbi:MAG: hypothetical protein JWQ09_1057 [Segetibacter sp.]|nr:hypothetical protein [Segetibacter sp.]
MIINRHNYEEFFLLYVDNELPPGERAAVEKFVQENPDVAEEMEMLKQATLPDEKIAFQQKELLYQQADGITLQNYEEFFLLSVDKELTEQEGLEVEKFVLKHPELQNEYTLLEQARLEPESILFAGKEKLYRKEEKERRVIFINWMRISAAAAIMGIATITWFFSQNNNQRSARNNPIAVTNKIVKPSPEKTGQPTKPAVKEETVAILHEKRPVKAETATKVAIAKNDGSKRGNDVFTANTIKNKPAQPIVPTEKIAVETENPVQEKKSFEDAIASARIPGNSSSAVVNSEPINATLASKHTLEQDATLAKHVVYREINNEEDDEEKSFYIGSAEINKNKLKGLFKKAASLFEKKNNNNDGERTLKIAGFEIKSK